MSHFGSKTCSSGKPLINSKMAPGTNRWPTCNRLTPQLRGSHRHRTGKRIILGILKVDELPKKPPWNGSVELCQADSRIFHVSQCESHFPPDISFTMETYSEHMETPAFRDTHSCKQTKLIKHGSNAPNDVWWSDRISPFSQFLSIKHGTVSLSSQTCCHFKGQRPWMLFHFPRDEKLMWHKSSNLVFGDWSVSGTRGTWTWQWLELDHTLQWRSSEGSNDTVDLHKPREWWETHNSSSNWVLQMYVKSFYPSSRLVVHLHSSSHPSKHLHIDDVHVCVLFHFDMSRTYSNNPIFGNLGIG